LSSVMILGPGPFCSGSSGARCSSCLESS
jgi:hypothetical protein